MIPWQSLSQPRLARRSSSEGSSLFLNSSHLRVGEWWLSLSFETERIPDICHFFYTGKISEKKIYTEKRVHKKVSTVKSLHRKVSILRSFWENLHWTEKNYTGTAGGAGDKYQVWLSGDYLFEGGADLILYTYGGDCRYHLILSGYLIFIYGGDCHLIKFWLHPKQVELPD